MSVKNFKVELCKRSDIEKFIEDNHYSKSINGLKSNFCFKLLDDNKLIGALIFGEIAMRNVWKKYVTNERDIIELRRLCCIDDTPKNTESYFISRCLRWMRDNTRILKVLSYADNEYGHSGIVYKATQFELLGETSTSRVINYKNKLYHDKTIRTTFNGRLKPFAQKIKDALESGDAKYKITKTKNIYLYNLNEKRKIKLSEIKVYSNTDDYILLEKCNTLDKWF